MSPLLQNVSRYPQADAILYGISIHPDRQGMLKYSHYLGLSVTDLISCNKPVGLYGRKYVMAEYL